MSELELLVRATVKLAETFDLAIIGGIALGAWTEPRNTSDVDVLIDSTDFVAIERAGERVGLVVEAEEALSLHGAGMTRLRLPDFRRGRVRIDVITVDHPYYERVVRRAVPANLYGSEVRVATAEDIVVLKALADRGQDRVDIESVLASQGEGLDRALVEQECAAIGIDPPW